MNVYEYVYVYVYEYTIADTKRVKTTLSTGWQGTLLLNYICKVQPTHGCVARLLQPN
jgi:hypothetical protein